VEKVIRVFKTSIYIFLSLYCLEAILFYYQFPLINYLQNGYYYCIKEIVRYVFNPLLGTDDLVVNFNGSTDRTIDFIKNFLFLIISFISSFYLVVIKQKKIKSDYVLLLFRLTSVLVLLNYGFAKIYDLQFSIPDAFRLSEEIGNMSPMRLLWTFMGVSYPYKVFIGCSQIMAAIFLLFRKTIFLGGVIAVAVFLNIFILNITFDGPLKSFSLILLIINMCLLLLTDQARYILKSIFERNGLHKQDKIFMAIVLVPFIMLNVDGYNSLESSKTDSTQYGEFFVNHNGTSEYRDIPRFIISRYGKIKLFESNYNSFYRRYKHGSGDNLNIIKMDLNLEWLGEGTYLLSGKFNNKVVKAKYVLNQKPKLIHLPFKLIHEFPPNESNSFKRRKFH
jgi:hypothetical protein